MHPLFQNLQNHNLNEANPHAEPHSAPHPFAGAVEAFNSTDQSQGQATRGAQPSQEVTQFSAHMLPFGNQGYKSRRGKR